MPAVRISLSHFRVVDEQWALRSDSRARMAPRLLVPKKKCHEFQSLTRSVNAMPHA
eukprot:CAMPEP_0198236288 /NCGR_PEP_ID=MMETSP1446-20131203/2185_1 /TAXON_ID=1461542 ORGANISM="Unidentified sp, Strain CCMP2111" /NCGR_SAMPLE_ID=MMETSP1446 /ASSEMBLY_ACC=CAM_ASM_001112 /LENGTH=55 /DNA_ID=CAMNT_0043917965 /DNA_START=79 /DNA_END=246 /DNA_ORIENTATION=+